MSEDFNKFRIGDMVRVTRVSDYYADWEGQEAMVTGIQLSRDGKSVMFEIEESGYRTDEWTADELEKIEKEKEDE